MQITRQQEIALWKLLATSLNLSDRGNGLYRGTCPFCHLPKIFGISINDNFSECLDCEKGGDSFVNTIKALFELPDWKNKLEKLVQISFPNI